MKVTAKEHTVYYRGGNRKPGEVFELQDDSHFDPKKMVKANSNSNSDSKSDDKSKAKSKKGNSK